MTVILNFPILGKVIFGISAYIELLLLTIYLASMITILETTAPELVERNGSQQRRIIQVKLQNDARPCGVRIVCSIGESSQETSTRAETGESLIEARVAEPESAGETVEISVRAVTDTGQSRESRLKIAKARPWKIHIVQLSHHDVGYTGLPSTVFDEHRQWLREAIEMARETSDYPEEARFRLLIEQAWSLMEFFRGASPSEANAMIKLLQEGRFELTAMFGNMTTELCGHEALVRSVYPSFDIAHRYNIPIMSAEHNDVPGFTWGLSQVLTDAGIKLFCPGLPLYWSWGEHKIRSFWNQEKIFGYDGPGAFWWQAPSGKRILFWYNIGLGGTEILATPSAFGIKLAELSKNGFPYSTLRWTVSGAGRDNAPYSSHYCDVIKDWNERYASPTLISSTNRRFYEDIVDELPENLPVWSADLPGPDYPVGATSTALATAVNRRNHTDLPKAEILASAARLVTDYKYPYSDLNRAYEDMLWHDEHTWGHHFPAGPGARASYYEKAVHAFRAEALAHDVASKAMAKISDFIKTPADPSTLRLVVFNCLPFERNGVVKAAMREIDNCNIMIAESIDAETGLKVRRGEILTDRPHIVPKEQFVQGRFQLIDEQSGVELPFEMRRLDGAMEPEPYAAERYGLGEGSRRFGFVDNPAGLQYNLIFNAKGVPGLGYRSFLLVPAEEKKANNQKKTAAPGTIENEFFSVSVDETGQISSIWEKGRKREWLDSECPHKMLELVLRTPDGSLLTDIVHSSTVHTSAGSIGSSIIMDSSIHAHSAVRCRIDLFAGDPKLHFAIRILKSPEPLLDVFLCFPFKADEAALSFEGTLCTLQPVKDAFPESFAEDLTVQNWVMVDSGDSALLWSTLDAPIVNLSRLRPGYVSPAHRAVMHDAVEHNPPETGDFNKGWIYSHIFGNNFGTNFSVSQVADTLFRYSVFAVEAGLPPEANSMSGSEMTMPLEAIFGATDRDGGLPAVGTALKVDPPDLILLTWKRSEDDRGYVLRFWNPEASNAKATIAIPGYEIQQARYINVCEEVQAGDIAVDSGSARIEAGPKSLATILIPDSGLKRSDG